MTSISMNSAAKSCSTGLTGVSDRVRSLILLRIALLTSVTLMTAFTAQAADFGVATWGQDAMSVRDLEQRPNLTPIGETRYLVYEASLPGIPETRLVYQFDNNQLVEGRFIFKASALSPTSIWLNHFQTVRTLIGQQYGEPERQSVLRPAEAAPISALERATALENDTLILKTFWHTESAQLIHQLAWNGSEPHHQLIYRPVSATPSAITEPAGASPF